MGDLADRVKEFFDEDWYTSTYPDVAASGMLAFEHFLEFGMAEGRDPGPEFESHWYLSNNLDVGNAGEIAFRHFVEQGMQEGRLPRPSRRTMSAIPMEIRDLRSILKWTRSPGGAE